MVCGLFRLCRFLFVFGIGFLFCFSAYAEGGVLRDFFKGRVVKKLMEEEASYDFSSVEEAITQAGDYYYVILHDSYDRMYRVHVPQGYNPAHPAPLVLAFHGGGGSMDYMARDDYYGLITKSEKEGFIAVFPNGFSKLKSGKFATWNAGGCCGDARDVGVDDVGFVKKILSNLSRQMNIDSGRVFAVGMSNGGMMSYRLACEMPETFKAIASVTGTDNVQQCTPSRPVSVLHVHAKNDTHVLFDGGAGEGSFRDPSKVTDFTSVPETIQRWTKRNQCSGEPRRVLSVDGAYCDLYEDCAQGTQIKLCVTDTGEHSWPGGYKSRGEEPSQAISANDQFWDFFKSLP